jgi:co-chaperonin GroES (HSP10)
MIRPLHNRILIDPIAPEQFRGDLWVPAETTTFRYDRPNEPVTAITRGRVVAKADNVRGVKVDDVVQFSDSCGRPVEHGGKRYLFIREDDVALIEG